MIELVHSEQERETESNLHGKKNKKAKNTYNLYLDVFFFLVNLILVPFPTSSICVNVSVEIEMS